MKKLSLALALAITLVACQKEVTIKKTDEVPMLYDDEGGAGPDCSLYICYMLQHYPAGLPTGTSGWVSHKLCAWPKVCWDIHPDGAIKAP